MVRRAASGPLVAGIVVAVPALALYAITLMPGVGLWDTAEFQAVGPVLGIAHPTGYPTYTILAWAASVVLQPFGDPAVRANLLSAIAVALSAGLVAATVTLLTRRAVVGVAAGAALAVTAAGWSVALRADPHAVHLLMAALLLLLLIVWADRRRAGEPDDRWLVAAAALFGVALGNHALTLLLAPGVGLFVVGEYPGILRRVRLLLACVAALSLTAVAVYAYLPIRSAADPPLDYANPQTWEGFRYLVFAEQFRGSFNAYPPLEQVVEQVAGGTLAQLGFLTVLALVGIVAAALTRPAVAALLGAWFTVNWAFALGYQNADIERYHLVPYLSAAALGGIGAAAVWRALELTLVRPRGADGASGDGRPRTRAVGALLAGSLAVVLLGPTVASMPARFDRVDLSDQHEGRVWLDAVLPQLEIGAVVVSWWSYSTPLWYAQFVDGERPDVLVVDDSMIANQRLGRAQDVIDAYLGDRPVYLIRLAADMPEFEAGYLLTALPGAALRGSAAVYRVDGTRGLGQRDPDL